MRIVQKLRLHCALRGALERPRVARPIASAHPCFRPVHVAVGLAHAGVYALAGSGRCRRQVALLTQLETAVFARLELDELVVLLVGHPTAARIALHLFDEHVHGIARKIYMGAPPRRRRPRARGVRGPRCVRVTVCGVGREY